jgi:hypothetical protein
MLKAIFCGAMIALAITTVSAAPNQYLCIAESMGGLHFDARTQSWKPQAFKADGKYVLRRINDDDRKRYDYLLTFPGIPNPNADWAFFTFGDNRFTFGENRPLATCLQRQGLHDFVCHSLPGAPAVLYTDGRRFEIADLGGYVGESIARETAREREQFYREFPDRQRQIPGLTKSDDPYPDQDLTIEVGKCSPF